MAEQRLMKDGLDAAAVERIAGSLARVAPNFAKTQFVSDAIDGLVPLELKSRVRHISAALNNHLPADFEKAAEILLSLKSNWIPGDPEDSLGGFAAWPVIDYVGEYGLDHPEIALTVLKELTSLFSAEFSIRPFIIRYFELTYRHLDQWCDDSDEHVRRLVSEGTRPRLPWGQRLPSFIVEPSPVFQLLEKLKDDPAEYVRRSVANNLNDISKDHPDQVIALCRRWLNAAGPDREWIIRHATRTLVKSGHPEVFGLLGFTENPRLEVRSLNVLPKQIYLGEAVEFSFKLQSTNSKPQSVIIDYAIHHVKANGNTSPKVFKYRTMELDPGEVVQLVKRHAIKPITTRKYYSGAHAVDILINGERYAREAFTLCLNN